MLIAIKMILVFMVPRPVQLVVIIMIMLMVMMIHPQLLEILMTSTRQKLLKPRLGRLRSALWIRSDGPMPKVQQLLGDPEIQGTYKWFHNCGNNPLIRPLSRVSQGRA